MEHHQSLRARLAASALLMVTCGAAFLALERVHEGIFVLRAASLNTSLDARVPFMPLFVFAYVLYYPWLVLPAAFLTERRVFQRALCAGLFTELVAAGLFLLFPSQMIRPAILPAGLAGDMLRSLYAVDAGWNVFPSLHVAHSTLIAMFFWKYRRDLFPVIALGSALISVSTVLIKQHYVLDVPAGLLLAAGAFWVVHAPFPTLRAQAQVEG
jgi:membrane-associated phospholipid phosphatase